MNIHTVDLYERYGIPRNGASGGFLTAFIRTESAEIKKRIRPSVLIIPGGGYEVLSDREAEPIAIKFMNSGFCAFVLSYSLRTKYLAPLIEAMLAMRFVRDNAEEYGTDKGKVCVTGFSAGGHLAGLLATLTQGESAFINKDIGYIRPDAVLLSYPVVTMKKFTHNGSRDTITGGDCALFNKLSVDMRVDKNTPPMFIWHTCKDNWVPVENSLMLSAALRQNERLSYAARFARRRKRKIPPVFIKKDDTAAMLKQLKEMLSDMHSYNKQHIEGLLAHLKMSEKMSACIYNILLAIATDEPVTKMQVEIGYMDDVPKRFIEFLNELLSAVFDDDDGDSEDIPNVVN